MKYGMMVVVALFFLIPRGIMAAPGTPNPPVDPKLIEAEANMIRAKNDEFRLQLERMLAESNVALNFAKAHGEEARARMIDAVQKMMMREFADIKAQEERILKIIESVRANQFLLHRLKAGKTDRLSFSAAMTLIAGVSEFATIKASLLITVPELKYDENFEHNDNETGLAYEILNFPGGDVRKLLLFMFKYDYSLKVLSDAQFAILTPLSAIEKDALDRIKYYEQEIMGVRSSRMIELLNFKF